MTKITFRPRPVHLALVLALIIALSASQAMLPGSYAQGSYSIMFSTSSARSNPAPLDGATVAGNVYVFTTPDAPEISQVRFFLDDPGMGGSPDQTENNPPYDFAGGSVSKASAFDTTELADGAHIITAALELTDGSIAVVHATFSVQNDVPNSGAALVFDPPVLSFSAPVHGNPAAQSVTLRATDGSSANATLSEDVSWLTVSPASTGTPAQLTVTANPADLVAGSYTATITGSAPGYETATLAVSLSLPGPGPDQIHLAWPDDPATTLTVLWRTLDISVPSVVEYRQTGDTDWLPATGSTRPSGTSGTLHEVQLGSLTPATAYEYRVQGPNNSWSQVFETRTAPAPGPAGFDFIYVADTGLIGRADGLATGTRQVIDEIASLNPLVVLGGGDYAYFNTDKRFDSLDNTIDAWFNQMQPIASRSPLMPTYGNHEALLQEDSSTWAERFPTPAGFDEHRNYSFDIGDVHFVSIFAVEGHDPLPGSLIDWIRQDIQAAQAAGQRWIIPYFHVSPFSEGTNHPSNIALREQLGPLFESLGVQIVIASHDQSYERTYPLVDVPATNTPTSTSTTCYTLDDGVTWIKVSPGGKLSNISKDFSPWDSGTPPHWTAFRDNTMHHFLRVRVSAEGSLQVEAFGVSGDGSPPVIQDTFEYTAGECPPPDTTPPAPPTGLTAVGTDSGTTLEWADNSEPDLTGYHVYRASDINGPFLKITSGPVASSSFSDISAPAGTSYYHVTAVDSSGNESDPSNVADADRPAATFDVVFSTASNRSNAAPLDGATVAGDIYVFTTPDAPEISQVRFFLDDPGMGGSPDQTENNPPYDFAGGSVSKASAFNTTTLSDGAHTITAALALDDGSTAVLHATFSVQNSGPAPAALMIDPPALSLAAPENGSPVSQNVTLSAADGSSASATVSDDVSWLTANPSATGTPAQLTITVDPSDLVAGNYTATVTASAPGYETATLAVSLSIESEGTDPPPVDFELLFSTASNRANPAPLEGATVAGEIFVFTTPDAPEIERVRFFLDDPTMAGAPDQTENNPPYDFEGGSVSKAQGFDTTELADGTHTITALLELDGGSSAVVHASFTVQNSGAEESQQSTFERAAW